MTADGAENLRRGGSLSFLQVSVTRISGFPSHVAASVETFGKGSMFSMFSEFFVSTATIYMWAMKNAIPAVPTINFAFNRDSRPPRSSRVCASFHGGLCRWYG